MPPYGNKFTGTVAYLGGIPALLEEFCWSWSQMVQYNTEYLLQPGELVYYNRARSSFHSFARNTLVKQMYGDWIIMLDGDIAFEPDLAVRLLYQANLYNLDVLTGWYSFKAPPYSPVLYIFDGKLFQPIGDYDSGVSIIEIGGAGAGCLFIRKTVFDKIEKELKEEPFSIHPPYSEDLSFFYRIHKLGIRAYCDTRIHVRHLLVHGVEEGEYQKEELTFGKRQEVLGYK